MFKSQFLEDFVDEPEEKKITEMDILYGPLDGKDPMPGMDIFDDLDAGDRGQSNIGEYQRIYDPVPDRVSSLAFIRNFYGKEILMRLRKELKECKKPSSPEAKVFISPELHRDMRKIYEKKRPPDKSTPIKSKIIELTTEKNSCLEPPLKITEKMRVNDPDEKYFLKTKRKLPRNKKYRKVFKGPSTVWEWLWSNIIRKGWNDTEGYPLKEKFFDNGFLVCSYSISKIAEECEMSKSTVSKFLKIFEEAGVIRIEYLKPKGKKRGQSVFILGEWKNIDGEYEEILYRDGAFD
jgi:hypothetical protein